MSYNIFHVIRDAVTGKLKFVNETVRQERRTLCDQCEVRDTVLDICTACGCLLSAKIRLKESTCPMELW